jgi:hypothetical protein
MSTVLAVAILLISPYQSPIQENKAAAVSGSPVGLTFDEFKKIHPLARCFFADDKKPDTLEFCIFEPRKDTGVVLFDRFPVKARTYHRTQEIGPGNYYFVLRDTSLGVLSAHASDVSVKTILTP